MSREQIENQAIEEMAYSVCRLENKPENCASCMWKASCENYLSAENYYAAGYRKQSESVWSTSVILDVPAQKVVKFGHICQSCFYLYKSKSQRGHKFCPNCGAHMKGGAE